MSLDINQIKGVNMNSNQVSMTSFRKPNFHSFINLLIHSKLLIEHVLSAQHSAGSQRHTIFYQKEAASKTVMKSYHWIRYSMRIRSGWETSIFSFSGKVVRPSGFYNKQEGTPSFSVLKKCDKLTKMVFSSTIFNMASCPDSGLALWFILANETITSIT